MDDWREGPMDFINQYSTEIIWLGIAIIFGIIESITLGLTTIWFAGGALVALVASLLGAPIGVQIALFIVISAVLLAFTRKVFVSKLKLGSEKTNVEALAGETAIVLKEVKFVEPGRVRIGGQEWAGVSDKEGQVFHEGEKVKVVGIEGVKAIVASLNEKTDHI